MENYFIVKFDSDKQTIETKITGYNYPISFNDLAVDALDVYRNEKLTPSELLRQNREMKMALEMALMIMPDGHTKEQVKKRLTSCNKGKE